ncbi:collagen alpha-1(I) chain-like [Canis lupus dingo]|uniref:collagen alpha-1(I) chain-like n=1 Tax=Canis lupus dingo TaxID=286419 RepID=UPI0020C3116F|nr:collagen alpha-1(I) chain-like [Canis lupus dingo]
MGRGLRRPRAGSGEGALGRAAGRPPGRLHPPRSPPLRPFRAGPARSRPREASAAAPPASGAPAPRGGGAAAVRPGRAPSTAAERLTGGDREPGPGSGRGRGRCAPRRPPPPRDGAAGQWRAPQPRGPSARPRPGSAPRARLRPPASPARSHAGGSNTRSRDPGRGRDGRVQAGSSPPFSPPTPAAPGRLGLGQPGGKRGKGRATGPQLPLSRRRQARRAAQPVHSPWYETAVVGSRKFPRLHFYSGRRFSARWPGYGAAGGCEEPRGRALTALLGALYPRIRSRAPYSFGETAFLCPLPTHTHAHTRTHPCTHNTPLPVLISFLLSLLAQEPRARHPTEWTSSLPVLKPREGRRESSEAPKLRKDGRPSRGECKKKVAVTQQRPRRRSKKRSLSELQKFTAKLGSCRLITAGMSLTLHVCTDRRSYLVLMSMSLPCRRRTLYDKIFSNILETIKVSKFNANPCSSNAARFFL